MRAHLGGAPQNASSGSMFNLLIPVYIILMGSFFLYVVINLFIGRKEPTTIKKKKCVECCRYKRSQSTTTTTTQGPGPSKRSKPSNIYETLPTYRAISQHGNDNGELWYNLHWETNQYFVDPSSSNTAIIGQGHANTSNPSGQGRGLSLQTAQIQAGADGRDAVHGADARGQGEGRRGEDY